MIASRRMFRRASIVEKSRVIPARKVKGQMAIQQNGSRILPQNRQGGLTPKQAPPPTQGKSQQTRVAKEVPIVETGLNPANWPMVGRNLRMGTLTDDDGNVWIIFGMMQGEALYVTQDANSGLDKSCMLASSMGWKAVANDLEISIMAKRAVYSPGDDELPRKQVAGKANHFGV